MKVNFRKLQKTLFIAFVFFWSLHPSIPYSSFFLHFFFSLLPLKSRRKVSFSLVLGYFCCIFVQGVRGLGRIEIACEVYFQRANKWVENKRWQCCWWWGCRENSPKDASVQEKMASFQLVYRSLRTTVLGVLILPLQHFIVTENVCKVRFQGHFTPHCFRKKIVVIKNPVKHFILFATTKHKIPTKCAMTC